MRPARLSSWAPEVPSDIRENVSRHQLDRGHAARPRPLHNPTTPNIIPRTSHPSMYGVLVYPTCVPWCTLYGVPYIHRTCTVYRAGHIRTGWCNVAGTETDRQQVAKDYEHLWGFIASLDLDGFRPQLAAVIADSKEAEVLLWDALIVLEGRLSKVEAQLVQLQQDHNKLLLLQMASQAENKFVHCAAPSLAPRSAAHMTFNHLSNGRDKGVNKAVFQQFVSKYPGLQEGLESLKDIGTPIAHPEMVRMEEGNKQPVTSMLLQNLINKEYSDDDPVKPDVEAVLRCLSDLAQELGESLFVNEVLQECAGDRLLVALLHARHFLVCNMHAACPSETPGPPEGQGTCS
ncbi:hypothetical protein VOLCADRAFT_93557 [Volvox carteri f. nagariensis]|uniref:Uncharacterized protein n=1 Tax=Volvox carteri f. nagariensis TaxID=3068 RepID=D8U2F6_VOLCA|nr:uncharacterized protein VOLCADRAFT_93557 [Volvox carteri f. nagariensis]EFJ46055.1 hypothetical protein VOLCADRAFT_93557 [Volvox carteri f. nagariensis]|eukprot:XP_002952805.1 hypothetical protein VOLCADRAFT_93557 [Volvox carteri f. nagariensis]